MSALLCPEVIPKAGIKGWSVSVACNAIAEQAALNNLLSLLCFDPGSPLARIAGWEGERGNFVCRKLLSIIAFSLCLAECPKGFLLSIHCKREYLLKELVAVMEMEGWWLGEVKGRELVTCSYYCYCMSRVWYVLRGFELPELQSPAQRWC